MTDKARIVRPEDEPPKTNRPFPDITPEQAEWIKRQPIHQAKPTMLHVEVSRRTFDAVRARPEKLKLIAEGADGVAVIEKPAAAGRARVGRVKWGEPLRETEVGTEAYNRLAAKPGGSVGGPAGSASPPDQHWKPKRDWTGETRFVPDARAGRADEYVVSDYDIFAVLKE